MTRRELLKLLLALPIAASIDVEELIWIPKQMVTIPTSYRPGISMSEIVAAEFERILPYMRNLFERDDIFYSIIKQ